MVLARRKDLSDRVRLILFFLREHLIYIYIRNALGVCSSKILSGRNETCHICSAMASNSLPPFLSTPKKDDLEENILNVLVWVQNFWMNTKYSPSAKQSRSVRHINFYCTYLFIYCRFFYNRTVSKTGERERERERERESDRSGWKRLTQLWPNLRQTLSEDFFLIKPTRCNNLINLFSHETACFGQFVCPSSGIYSLYTQQWNMSYRFVDSFRAAGPGWNCSSILVLLLESCLQTCMTYTSTIAECKVNKLLMMDRRTVRNMQFHDKINLWNCCI